MLHIRQAELTGKVKDNNTFRYSDAKSLGEVCDGDLDGTSRQQYK